MEKLKIKLETKVKYHQLLEQKHIEEGDEVSASRHAGSLHTLRQIIRTLGNDF